MLKQTVDNKRRSGIAGCERKRHIGDHQCHVLADIDTGIGVLRLENALAGPTKVLKLEDAGVVQRQILLNGDIE